MIECQFCRAKLPEGANPKAANWYQADLEIFICPACAPQAMRPEPPDATNLSQEELDEIAQAKMEYFQRHYSK